MKFSSMFTSLVQQLLSNQTAHIADAELISEPFEKLIKNLQAIRVEKEFFEVAAYANDLM
ncbi:11999_t:CDS:2, partial [Gigaspora rosea]